jgi:hypothetical protein
MKILNLLKFKYIKNRKILKLPNFNIKEERMKDRFKETST